MKVEIVLLFLSFCLIASKWSGTSHSIIAEIAQEGLSLEAQKQVRVFLLFFNRSFYSTPKEWHLKQCGQITLKEFQVKKIIVKKKNGDSVQLFTMQTYQVKYVSITKRCNL